MWHVYTVIFVYFAPSYLLPFNSYGGTNAFLATHNYIYRDVYVLYRVDFIEFPCAFSRSPGRLRAKFYFKDPRFFNSNYGIPAFIWPE